MLKRDRGFTLIELMVGIVMLGLVGLMMAQLMTSMLRVTTAQVQKAGSQATARTGVSAIPLEFREIGFDTIPDVGTDTDLEAIGRHRLTFRAMRGTGMTCGISAGVDELWIRVPVFGLREPVSTDSFRLFVENDVNRGDDDQWVTLEVNAIDNSSTCGPDKAIRLEVSVPEHTPGLGDVVDAADVFVGGPVRWYEVMEYGPVIDGGTNRTYVGARSINLGQNTLLPMIGPLVDSTGFTLTYFDGDGVELSPTVATNRIKVRSIGINLTGATTGPISLAGATNFVRDTTPVFTRVALRNNLRQTAP